MNNDGRQNIGGRVDEVRRAAARERWAPRIWWAALALGTGAALGASGRWGWVGVGLWGVAWVAPWLAVASFRGKREEGERPESGGGSTEDWLEYGEGLERRLAWAGEVAKGTALAGRLKGAKEELRRALRKGVREARALEGACEKAEKDGREPFEAWLWGEIQREVRELEDEVAREGGGAVDGGTWFERLSEAMGDAAARVVRRLAPMWLAEEQLEAVRECVGLAWLASGAGSREAGAGTEGTLIALAAALAIEKGYGGGRWEPWGALERARERAGTTMHNAQFTMRNGGEEAREGREGDGAAALLPVRKRVRVKVWRKGRRKRRGGGLGRELRRIGEIFVAFGQRMRYFLTAWWIYRK